MKTLVPIKDEMTGLFLKYVRDHREEMTQKQAHAIMRYARDPFIMNLMENSFYQNWDDTGRYDTIEKFCSRVVVDLLNVYGEGVERK